jgi:hypothetical protein
VSTSVPELERSRAVPSLPIPCAVETYGTVRVPFEGIAALRKNPGPLGGRVIKPSLLNQADHQTILGLAALLRAVDAAGWHGKSFEHWGVIAAPRFLGRIIVAAAMERFRDRGVTGMSPMIIPTVGLHSISGSLSMALKIQGFNYGVGGSHGHLADALLTALAARDDGVPGIWVVSTQFSPEPVPDGSRLSTTEAVGYAVAMALTPTPEAASRSRLNLRLVPTSARTGTSSQDDDRDVHGDDPPSGLVALTDFLDNTSESLRPRHWYCPLPGGGAVALDDDPARAALPGKTKAG